VNPNHIIPGTCSQNNKYAIDCGRVSRKGSGNGQSILTEELVKEIKIFGLLRTRVEVARKFNITQSQASQIMTGKRWPHVK